MKSIRTVLALAALAAPAAPRVADADGLARPSPAQYAWHEQERIMFIHFGVATWENAEYDRDGTTDLSKMNPAGFDADEVCRAAKSWGARQILLVAKHVGGFCWWPTETTDYCVRSIPWKGGKGNLVKDVADACRRHGLSMGVYLYPDDTRFAKGIGRGGRTDDPARQEEWSRLFRRQWEEVLGLCGPDLLREVWLDGGCVIDLGDILRRMAPNAVVFQGRNATIRWVGNEEGIARDPNWNALRGAVLQTGVATQEHSNPDGDAWAPTECDTTLYTNKWFWNPANEAGRKSLDQLMSLYVQSAGRGSVLLLNSTPDSSGRIPAGDIARYREFGGAIERNFGRPLAVATNAGSATVELDLGGARRVSASDLWEDYRLGHRIRAYTVEGRAGDAWTALAQGTAVGRRKIDLFAPVTVDRVRVRVTDASGAPVIRRFQVHAVEDSLLDPARRVRAPARWEKAGEWSGDAEIRADLTAVVTRAGQYEVRFVVSGKPVVVERAVLLLEGRESPPDLLSGVGTAVLTLNRTQAVGEGASTALRVVLRAPPGGRGPIQVRPKE
jgi:alpha-L-fucosidase